MANIGQETADIAGAIIMYNSKILLICGTTGKWSFPKGRRHENETPLQAAMREAQEEAGIDLSGAVPLKTVYLNKYGTYYIYAFSEMPVLGSPSTPDEVTDIQWFTYSYAKELDKNASLTMYLKYYHNTHHRISTSMSKAQAPSVCAV